MASQSGIPILQDAGDAALFADAVRRRDAGDAGLYGLAAALPLVGGTTVKRGAKAAKDYLRDWSWKPQDETLAKLGMNRGDPLPEHVEPFGRFMAGQQKKAQEGKLTARDLIKAYTITRSSIRRKGRNPDSVPEVMRGAKEGHQVRPEDAYGAWLQSPMGKRYLDAAEKGKVDQEAIADAVEKMKVFGMPEQLGRDMEWAVGALPGKEKAVSEMVAAGVDPAEWLTHIDELSGVGISKGGFYGSMLGYGQMPTMDARQLNLHAVDPDAWKNVERRGGGQGAVQGVNRLSERMADINLQLPEGMEPYRQHLTHHAVWDKAAGAQTTHQGIMDAMQYGRIDPRLLYALAGAGALGAVGAPYALKGDE
jgi:hypothetical protein